MDEPTQTLLERWKVARRPFGAGKPHLFVCVRAAQRGEPISRLRVYRDGPPTISEGGDRLARPSPRAQTHFATRALGDGFTITDVQKMMRHARLETTAVYLEVRDEDLKAKIRARGRRRAA